MNIHQIYSLTATADDAIIIDMLIDDDEFIERVNHTYRASDPYGPLTPIITQWIADNNPEIQPYIPPAPPAPQELREQMPDKTPREFRDILTDMGIFPQMVTDAIMEIPFDIERQKALNAWEVMTSASRVDPYIDMIGAMFDKTPEQIDDAWLGGV